MRRKDETREAISSFINLIHNQIGIRVKIIRSDNGSEFAYNDLYDKSGIIHQISCIETLQHDFVVERNKIFSMLIEVCSSNLRYLSIIGLSLLYVLYI